MRSLRIAPIILGSFVLALGHDVLAQPAPPQPGSAGTAAAAPGSLATPIGEAPRRAAVLERIGLDAAIRRALARAVPIALARAEVARAEALLRQTRAGWLPKLSANAAYTRLDDERRTGGQRLLARDQLSADLRLTLPLLAAPRWVETDQASDAVRIAQADVLEERRQLALAVAYAYLSVMAQHRVIEVNERALLNARAHYHYAHTRFTGGIGNELDDVRAAEQVESTLAQLERAHAELVAAQEALGVLLGEDAPLDVLDTLQLPESGELARALSEAESNRSDVLADRLRVRAAEDALDASWVDYLPFLTAELRPFLTEPPTATLPRSGWQAQLVLSVPLYDGGYRYGARDRRAAELAQSRTLLEATLRQARSEVRVAFETARRADAGLRAATRAAELASRALQMAMEAYQAGATTDIEVLDAERRARDAATAAVVAEDAARRARLELLTASGRWP